jgi:transcriptional regulator with GAF, ATPase, and Fis domain
MEAWFHSIGNDRSIESSIRQKLVLEDIRLHPYNANAANRCGILCFTEFNDQVATLLQTAGRSQRVIAVSLGANPLTGGTSWKLLRAGAADVLGWSEEASIGAQIKARFERWNSIDALIETDAVRESLVGESAAWKKLVSRIVEAARFTQAPILLIGESGTGKELLARFVHLFDERAVAQRGDRRELVTLDCTTIVPELSGSELFGHERGAFTGAATARDGVFALANEGTLFLDEVGELPLNLQASLLRAVQEKTYKRIGGNVWQTTDFRLICATNRDLTEAVARGEFRLDLYYRIAGIVFRTPPLRERPEDILPLAKHFLNKLYAPQNRPEFDSPVREYLLNRPYPGNVRDLRRVVERIVHRHVGPGAITVGDIPEEDRPVETNLPRAWATDLERAISQAITVGAGLKEINQAAAEAAIRVAVEAEGGNLQRAARRLGVTDRALQMRRAAARATGDTVQPEDPSIKTI